MDDYQKQTAFGTNVLPHNTPASFTNLNNGSQKVNGAPANGGPASFTVQQNGGGSNVSGIQGATKSDATAPGAAQDFGSFIGQK